MRLARLVSTWVFYRLDNAHVRQRVEDAVFNAGHAGAEVPAHHRVNSDLASLPAAPDAGLR